MKRYPITFAIEEAPVDPFVPGGDQQYRLVAVAATFEGDPLAVLSPSYVGEDGPQQCLDYLQRQVREAMTRYEGALVHSDLDRLRGDDQLLGQRTMDLLAFVEASAGRRFARPNWPSLGAPARLPSLVMTSYLRPEADHESTSFSTSPPAVRTTSAPARTATATSVSECPSGHVTVACENENPLMHHPPDRALG